VSSNNWWLHRQLRIKGVQGLEQETEPLILIDRGSRFLRIYTPEPDEYVISADVVRKVIDLGGNLISYPVWCVGPTGDATALAEDHGIVIQGHGKTFGDLS